MTSIFHTSFETGFGRLGIVWKERHEEPVIVRVLFPEEERFHGEGAYFRNRKVKKRTCRAIDAVTETIKRMTEGETVMFDLGRIDLDACNPFQKKVLLAEYGIPRGKVSTYGKIARFIGCPGGARAVGNALATNPFPLIIPCHRAVRTDGRLGGFRGGIEMKRSLLRLEGVAVDGRNRVRTTELYY